MSEMTNNLTRNQNMFPDCISTTTITASVFTKIPSIPSTHLGCSETDMPGYTGANLSANRCSLKCLQDLRCVGFYSGSISSTMLE